MLRKRVVGIGKLSRRVATRPNDWLAIFNTQRIRPRMQSGKKISAEILKWWVADGRYLGKTDVFQQLEPADSSGTFARPAKAAL
ncbi:hypothetical protein MKFW12EY_28680 [Methylomonas koyamae]|nr:hypothetical protein MKFW12EY_28680 [Methylomonas koyamae]